MMGLSEAAFKVFLMIDWSQIVIQVVEMLWYSCEKLWTLFSNHYLRAGGR